MKRDLRAQRLNHAIAEAVQAYILPEAVDERLSRMEVAAVEIAGDLHNVTIHLVPALGEEAWPAEDLKEPLQRAEPWMRAQLTEHVSMRKSPAVHLSYIPLVRKKR
jgi:ribosome-binding factor A